MGTKAVPLEEMIRLINQFGDSTEDCYALYDPKKDRLYFSENITATFDKFEDDSFSCPSEVWRSVVYPPDYSKVRTVTRELLECSRSSFNFNYRIKDPNGRIIWINSRGKSYGDEQGKNRYILGRLSRQAATETPKEIHRPALTGEVKELYESGQNGYLLVMGIDDLRRINLKNGREFGDAVIQAFEDHIQMAAGGKPVFRINGDCFCVILPDSAHEDVDGFFCKIQKGMEGQCTISGGAVSLQAYHVADGSILVEYAESALEAAKLSGKAQLSFFAPSDYERKLGRLELLDELEKAVENDFAGFSLYYQGQVLSETFELYGAEVLLRFETKKRGMANTKEVISILEESGLIYPVGLWIIEKALEQCRIWRQTLPDFHISINMSYKQLQYGEIQGDVLKILEESGLPGSAVTFEVTESMELQDYTHLNVLFSAWKNAGIEISVDDFGTGYSGLSWLKELAVDEIKIDRCFIREIQKSAYNLRLLSNIIELADSCHMRVCCEGVETKEELTILEELHPSTYQGFLFSEPCSPERFAAVHFGGKSRLNDKKTADMKTADYSHLMHKPSLSQISDLEHEIFGAIEDIVSVIDPDTYELYYMNPAGRRIYGMCDFRGRKCYRTFWGKDAPCKFCPAKKLSENSFHVWETWNSYCGNHLLIKDKLMQFNGKMLRLQVGVDITNREYISRETRERLAFSQKIIGYVETLRSQTDCGHAVEQVLASVGDYYKADRVNLFQRDATARDTWNNTFEWCADGITSQKDSLQGISPEIMRRWLEPFEKNQSVIIYNIDALRKSSPLEYQALQMHGIQRLIAVPVPSEKEIDAFIGVDNPRHSIHDDSQIRVLAAFLSEKLVTMM